MSIYYKFQSARDFDTLQIDGPQVTLSELKKAIIAAKKLGKGIDFDLEIADAQTNIVYKDDGPPIPKNTSVVIRRVPRAKLASIVQPASTPVNTTVSSQKQESSLVNPENEKQPDPLASETRTETAPGMSQRDKEEEDKLIQLIHQTDEWRSTGTTTDTGITSGIPSSTTGSGRRKREERPLPPPGYICYRCNQPGHWIDQCPTNGDPNYDFHKVKKATGIPRSFLERVQGGNAKGALIHPEGGYAVMRPNEEVLLKEIEKMKFEGDGTYSIPESLKCSLCNGLLNDAVLIPCCGYSFCDDCIRPHDPTESLTCPHCKKNINPSRLVPNITVRKAVELFKKKRDEEMRSKGAKLKQETMTSAQGPTSGVTPSSQQLPPQSSPVHTSSLSPLAPPPPLSPNSTITALTLPTTAAATATMAPNSPHTPPAAPPTVTPTAGTEQSVQLSVTPTNTNPSKDAYSSPPYSPTSTPATLLDTLLSVNPIREKTPSRSPTPDFDIPPSSPCPSALETKSVIGPTQSPSSSQPTERKSKSKSPIPNTDGGKDSKGKPSNLSSYTHRPPSSRGSSRVPHPPSFWRSGYATDLSPMFPYPIPYYPPDPMMMYSGYPLAYGAYPPGFPATVPPLPPHILSKEEFMRMQEYARQHRYRSSSRSGSRSRSRSHSRSRSRSRPRRRSPTPPRSSRSRPHSKSRRRSPSRERRRSPSRSRKRSRSRSRSREKERDRSPPPKKHAKGESREKAPIEHRKEQILSSSRDPSPLPNSKRVNVNDNNSEKGSSVPPSQPSNVEKKDTEPTSKTKEKREEKIEPKGVSMESDKNVQNRKRKRSPSPELKPSHEHKVTHQPPAYKIADSNQKRSKGEDVSHKAKDHSIKHDDKRGDSRQENNKDNTKAEQKSRTKDNKDNEREKSRNLDKEKNKSTDKRSDKSKDKGASKIDTKGTEKSKDVSKDTDKKDQNRKVDMNIEATRDKNKDSRNMDNIRETVEMKQDLPATSSSSSKFHKIIQSSGEVRGDK
jgi:E3 ubiquitin-protein ligase RBBP6